MYTVYYINEHVFTSYPHTTIGLNVTQYCMSAAPTAVPLLSPARLCRCTVPPVMPQQSLVPPWIDGWVEVSKRPVASHKRLLARHSGVYISSWKGCEAGSLVDFSISST